MGKEVKDAPPKFEPTTPGPEKIEIRPGDVVDITEFNALEDGTGIWATISKPDGKLWFFDTKKGIHYAEKEEIYPFGPNASSSRKQSPETECNVVFIPNVVIARGHEEEGFNILDAEERLEVHVTLAVPPPEPSA